MLTNIIIPDNNILPDEMLSTYNILQILYISSDETLLHLKTASQVILKHNSVKDNTDGFLRLLISKLEFFQILSKNLTIFFCL